MKLEVGQKLRLSGLDLVRTQLHVFIPGLNAQVQRTKVKLSDVVVEVHSDTELNMAKDSDMVYLNLLEILAHPKVKFAPYKVTCTKEWLENSLASHEVGGNIDSKYRF